MKTIKRLTTVLNSLGLVMLIGLFAVFGVAHTVLPERAPSVIVGNTVTEWSDNTLLMIVFWAGIVIYGVLYIMKRFPRLMLYPVKTTPENVVYQAELGKLFLAALSFFAMVLFVILEFKIFISAYGKTVWGNGDVYIAVGCIAASVAVYLIMAIKHK